MYGIFRDSMPDVRRRLMSVLRHVARSKPVSKQQKSSDLGASGDHFNLRLVVDDRWQRSGLGRRLMGALIDCAREKSYRSMVGDVLADNPKMLRLMTGLGFSIMPHPDSQELKRVLRALQD